MSDEKPCPHADGCSGGVSWFYRHILRSPARWEYCCDEHDVAYSEGGTSADRALADRRPQECIADAGYPVRAWMYWAAVRVFGGRHWER